MKKKIFVIDTRKLSEPEAKSKFQEATQNIKPSTVIIDLREVEYFSSLGLTQEEMCEFYGIVPETMSRNKKKYKEISQALLRGYATDLINTTAELNTLIKQGHFPAIRFKLIARHGWKEEQVIDFTVKEKEDLKEKIKKLLFE